MSSKRRAINLVSLLFLLSSISKSLLIKIINYDYNNYNNNYAFGRKSRKLFCFFKGLP